MVWPFDSRISCDGDKGAPTPPKRSRGSVSSGGGQGDDRTDERGEHEDQGELHQYPFPWRGALVSLKASFCSRSRSTSVPRAPSRSSRRMRASISSTSTPSGLRGPDALAFERTRPSQ